jgi:hypothetical protein
MQACGSVDKAWVRRGTSWSAASTDNAAASDNVVLETGELTFLHGKQ